MNAREQKTLADIERYGCSVMHVLPEGDLPPFAYSIGIQRSAGRPEVVAIGLKQPIAHFVVNEYNRRMQDGERLIPGQLYGGFLEGFDVLVEQVDHQFYGDYFGWNLWLYGGHDFEVLQLVYPTTAGVWSWQKSASAWFRAWQPLLTSSPLSPGRYP